MEKLIVNADFDGLLAQQPEKRLPPLRAEGGGVERQRHLAITGIAQAANILYNGGGVAHDVAGAPGQLTMRMLAAAAIDAVKDAAPPYR